MRKYPAKIMAAGHDFTIAVDRQKFEPLPLQVEQKVDDIWRGIKEWDPGIQDTKLLAAHEVIVEGDTLRLVCGESSRRYLKGTTDKTVFDIEGGKYVRRGVSMLSVTTTVDGYLFMGVRKPVITYPFQRHHVAGRLTVAENDPVNGIYCEYEEEVGLMRHEVLDLKCIGVAADLVYGSMSYEFIFRAKTILMARELITRALMAKSADEHIMFEAFSWDPDVIRETVLLPEPDGFPPTGWVGLVMALRHEFGKLACAFDWEPTPMAYKEFMGRRGEMLGIK